MLNRTSPKRNSSRDSTTMKHRLHHEHHLQLKILNLCLWVFFFSF